MKIFEVNSNNMITQFLNVPVDLYKKNPNWTIQLGSDIEHAFIPEYNSLLSDGNAKRWLIYDEWNKPVGRIAGFYNKSEIDYRGAFGFFECIENYNCAATLLSTAIDWLKAQGCKSIEGPVNFGEKDRFWGVLTSGFDMPSLYLDNYNYPYYVDFFERFGLIEKDVIYTYKVEIVNIPGERIGRIAKRLEEREQITFKAFDFNNIEASATDLHQIYIHSFDQKKRFKHLSVQDIIQLIKSSRKVIDENLIWMAYKANTPIGLLAFMKDLNQTLAFGRKRDSDEINLKGFAFSVVPEYRNHGIELGLCSSLYKKITINDEKYALYFSGINSKTKQMDSFMKSLNASISKIHKTYTTNND